MATSSLQYLVEMMGQVECWFALKIISHTKILGISQIFACPYHEERFVNINHVVSVTYM